MSRSTRQMGELMTDALSALFGGPSQEEVLGDARLKIWQSFESVNSMFDGLGPEITDPEFLKGFLRGVVLRIVAEANISDVIAHEPVGGFSSLYPKHEAIAMIREELSRALHGGVGWQS